MQYQPILIGLASAGWLICGVVAAARLCRANQRRGTRRYPAVEGRTGRIYLLAAAFGPVSILLTWAVQRLWRIRDAEDAAQRRRGAAARAIQHRTARTPSPH
jgi:hypothetical protein